MAPRTPQRQRWLLVQILYVYLAVWCLGVLTTQQGVLLKIREPKVSASDTYYIDDDNVTSILNYLAVGDLALQELQRIGTELSPSTTGRDCVTVGLKVEGSEIIKQLWIHVECPDKRTGTMSRNQISLRKKGEDYFIGDVQLKEDAKNWINTLLSTHSRNQKLALQN